MIRTLWLFGVNIWRVVQLHSGGFLWKWIQWSFCCPCNYSGGNQQSHYQWFGFSLWVEVTHSFLFSFLSLSPLLSNPSFFVILEATCSNCWRKQYATHDPTYTLQFTTISLSNIRKKHSPLQLVKLSNSQTNAVYHTLCNQCFCFLSKDIKKQRFCRFVSKFSLESSCW